METAAVASGHCIARVHHEIEQHLLKLHSVAEDWRQDRREVRLDGDALIQQIAADELKHLLHDLIHIERLALHLALFQKRAQAPDDLAGMLVGVHDVAQNFLQLCAVDLRTREEALRRLRIAEDCGQRLVEFVRERAGQFAEHRHAREMGQFRALVLHILLARRNVNGNAAHPQRAAVVGKLDPAPRGDPTQRRRVREYAIFAVIVAAIFERRRDRGAQRLTVVRVEPSGNAREVQRFRLRESEELAPLVGGPDFITRDVPYPEPQLGGARRQIDALLNFAQLIRQLCRPKHVSAQFQTHRRDDAREKQTRHDRCCDDPPKRQARLRASHQSEEHDGPAYQRLPPVAPPPDRQRCVRDKDHE